MKIAFETYGDIYKWRQIYEANKDQIKDANSVPKGTVLKIDKPGSPVAIDKNGDPYEIKKGDTLGTISTDHLRHADEVEEALEEQPPADQGSEPDLRGILPLLHDHAAGEG